MKTEDQSLSDFLSEDGGSSNIVSDSDEPIQNKDGWEIQRIRGHYPLDSTKYSKCHYYVQFRLKKDQIEDWDDSENWIWCEDMRCNQMLEDYWKKIRANKKRGRRPLPLRPPLIVSKERIEKINEKVAKEDKGKTEKAKVAAEREKRHIRRSTIKLENESVMENSEENMRPVSSIERPKREHKKKDAEIQGRQEELQRLRNYADKSKVIKEERSKESVFDMQAVQDDSSTLVPVAKPKRKQIDEHCDNIRNNELMLNLRKKLAERKDHEGHWRAKDSLQDSPTSVASRILATTPAYGEPAKKKPREGLYDPDFEEISRSTTSRKIAKRKSLGDKNVTSPMPSSIKRSRGIPKSLTTPFGNKPRTSLSATYRRAAIFDNLPKKPATPETTTPPPTPTANPVPKVIEVIDISSDDDETPLIEPRWSPGSPILPSPAKFSPKADRQVENVIDQADSNLVITEHFRREEESVIIPENLPADVKLQLGRFCQEAFTMKYKAIQNKLKPLYVLGFAKKNERDFALTVFAKDGNEVCEAVLIEYMLEMEPAMVHAAFARLIDYTTPILQDIRRKYHIDEIYD